MKNVIILGSGGSVGTQTLEVIARYPEQFKVTGLAVNGNIERLLAEAEKFKPNYVAAADAQAQKLLKNNAKIKEWGIKVLTVDELSAIKCDVTVNAIVGLDGLVPSLNSLKAGNALALANKEPMVAAGKFLKEAESKFGGRILPVDSEHSAVWQCLDAGKRSQVKKVWITASGGALRDKSLTRLESVTPAEALNHPVWKMGKKVTVDSATLINKALEILEAANLFELSADEIGVLIHRQSIMHAAVEYRDGGLIAHLASPDMKLPIQYALTYPDRCESGVSALDLAKIGNLSFECADFEKYPAIGLAYKVLEKGGRAAVALTAADEGAVNLFLSGKIRFTDIVPICADAVARQKIGDCSDIAEVIQLSKNIKSDLYARYK